MSATFQRLKGFADIYGQQAERFSRLEGAARDIFQRYGFEELRTPIIEATGLFQRSIGTETDVVKKEMFTFSDNKGRSMTLRPEATAGVMRACIEEGLAPPGQIARLFTIGPMFRHERPQKGRMRQFHQINCECLGSDSPYADAELISMLMAFLNSLQFTDLRLKINSLGCRDCRGAYLEKLRAWLLNRDQDRFCADCRVRITANPLRVLDCKQEECGSLLVEAPKLLDHICDDCRRHMDMVLRLLHAEGLRPEIDHRLVRGLDYYQRTTFEVASENIGAQTAVAGGGRYDGLIRQLGGSDVPGVGFACGMERLALLLEREGGANLDFYLVTPFGAQREKAFLLAQSLRRQGMSGEMNYADGSFKSLMRQAARSGARFALILGPDEESSGAVTIKNMENGDQGTVSQVGLAHELGLLLGRVEQSA